MNPGEQSTLELHTGNRIPILGLGTWQMTENTAGTVEHALELGYPMIDTSGDYGTQPGIGDGLRELGIRREAVYLVTKIEETDNAFEATRENLEELGVDYVDLMLIHRPPVNGVGEHLWEGLLRARDDGLTVDIGVSNYSAEQIDGLLDSSGEKPVVNQIEWSPFGYSNPMLEYCREHDIVIQAYSPLTRRKRLDDPLLTRVAAQYGKSPAQLLIRWNIQRGTVPIPKANQREHLEDNLDVFDFAISDDDMEILNRCNERYSSLGTLPYI